MVEISCVSSPIDPSSLPTCRLIGFSADFIIPSCNGPVWCKVIVLLLWILLGNLSRTLITVDGFPTGNYTFMIVADIGGRIVSEDLPIRLSGWLHGFYCQAQHAVFCVTSY